MSTQHKRQGRATVLLTGLLFVVLCGCSIIPQIRHQTPRQIEQPIIAPLQSYRVIQVCLDTPPLFSARFFREAAMAIADKIDASVMPNQGGLTVFVSLIEHDSLQTNVLSISVPALAADSQEPTLQVLPNPASYQSPYDYADAVDKVKKANAQLLNTWQARLKSNHQQLTTIRAAVKQETNKLRSLPVPFDNTGADVYGCLDLASQHFHSIKAVKTLLIASPLVNNTNSQETSSISLAGVSVKVIFHTCPQEVASVCLANDARWKQSLLSFGVKDVSIFDPLQSETWHITF
jgi:hypothetical protein